MPLHPVVMRTFGRMLSTWAGWQALSRHALPLVEMVAGTLGSPHLRARPDIQQVGGPHLPTRPAAASSALHA